MSAYRRVPISSFVFERTFSSRKPFPALAVVADSRIHFKEKNLINGLNRFQIGVIPKSDLSVNEA